MRQAADVLGVCLRQAYRIKKKVKEKGVKEQFTGTAAGVASGDFLRIRPGGSLSFERVSTKVSTTRILRRSFWRKVLSFPARRSGDC